MILNYRLSLETKALKVLSSSPAVNQYGFKLHYYSLATYAFQKQMYFRGTQPPPGPQSIYLDNNIQL